MVAGQRKEGNKWVKYRVTFYDPDYPVKDAKTFFSGCAGFSSTANDYATFLQMCLSKGELNRVRLLSRTTVNSIMSNELGTIWDGNKYYGLAFGLINEEALRPAARVVLGRLIGEVILIPNTLPIQKNGLLAYCQNGPEAR